MEKALLTELSKDLEISREKIIDTSINAFLEKELRDASADILKIKEQFSTKSAGELKKLIEAGKIVEHPAWEQLIYWENLNKRVRVVNNWMQRLHNSS